MTKHNSIVLAGGAGTRLWPYSRQYFPKQLLRIDGKHSLLQITAKRLIAKIDPYNIHVVTSQHYESQLAEQLKVVHERLTKNIYLEPIGRNTLPAIAWMVSLFAQKDPDGVTSVFTSDHVIGNEKAFFRALDLSVAFAHQGYMVLFGIEPTRPATAYGYVKAGHPLTDSNRSIFSVEQFVEKPDFKTAQKYLEEGGFYWNSGMFVFKNSVFLEELQKYEPKIYKLCKTLIKKEIHVADQKTYAAMPHLSIDYGLIEKTKKVAVVPVDMDWNDLGSWDAVYKYMTPKTHDNVIQGNVIADKSHGNLIWSQHGLVATLGVHNMAILQTRDATLVCPRDKTEGLKSVFDLVKKEDSIVTERHPFEERPWGSFVVLTEGKGFKVKKITVKPGARLSLQSHKHRAEHWVVVSGTAHVQLDEKEIVIKTNETAFITAKTKHRLTNHQKKPLTLIEVQIGNCLEDDIERFEDDFGRVQ